MRPDIGLPYCQETCANIVVNKFNKLKKAHLSHGPAVANVALVVVIILMIRGQAEKLCKRLMTNEVM